MPVDNALNRRKEKQRRNRVKGTEEMKKEIIRKGREGMKEMGKEEMREEQRRAGKERR